MGGALLGGVRLSAWFSAKISRRAFGSADCVVAFPPFLLWLQCVLGRSFSVVVIWQFSDTKAEFPEMGIFSMHLYASLCNDDRLRETTTEEAKRSFFSPMSTSMFFLAFVGPGDECLGTLRSVQEDSGHRCCAMLFWEMI